MSDGHSLSPRGEGWGEGAKRSNLIPLTLPAFGWDNPASRFATGPFGFDRKAIERVVPSPRWGEGMHDEVAS
jgi:hypothetical protein